MRKVFVVICLLSTLVVSILAGFVPSWLITDGDDLNSFIQFIEAMEYHWLHVVYFAGLLGLQVGLSLLANKIAEEKIVLSNGYKLLFSIINKTGSALYSICSVIAGVSLFVLYLALTRSDTGDMLLTISIMSFFVFYLGAFILNVIEEFVLNLQRFQN